MALVITIRISVEQPTGASVDLEAVGREIWRGGGQQTNLPLWQYARIGETFVRELHNQVQRWLAQ